MFHSVLLHNISNLPPLKDTCGPFSPSLTPCGHHGNPAVAFSSAATGGIPSFWHRISSGWLASDSVLSNQSLSRLVAMRGVPRKSLSKSPPQTIADMHRLSMEFTESVVLKASMTHWWLVVLTSHLQQVTCTAAYATKYIQSWPKILAPLVNMIKGGCENLSALLILLSFFFLKI